jgi:hypothetical protein
MALRRSMESPENALTAALLPGPYGSAAFLLDVTEWLTEYKIRLV